MFIQSIVGVQFFFLTNLSGSTFAQGRPGTANGVAFHYKAGVFKKSLLQVGLKFLYFPKESLSQQHSSNRPFKKSDGKFLLYLCSLLHVGAIITKVFSLPVNNASSANVSLCVLFLFVYVCEMVPAAVRTIDSEGLQDDYFCRIPFCIVLDF